MTAGAGAGKSSDASVDTAQAPEREEQRSGAQLIFRLGHITLALPSSAVRAVSPSLPLCRVPQYPSSAFLGLVAFAGEIAPCCSLERILLLPEADAGANARTVLLQQRPGELWAFPAGEVLTVTSGSERARQAEDLHPDIGEAWSDMIFADGEGCMAMLLKPEPLFKALHEAVQ